jgi:hypothetical protein
MLLGQNENLQHEFLALDSRLQDQAPIKLDVSSSK